MACVIGRIEAQSGAAPLAKPVPPSEPIASSPPRMRTRTAPWLRS